MPKGYLIAHIDVHDKDMFAKFRAASAPVLKAHGATVLVGNFEPEQREGELKPMTIVVEFPDVATAREFYDSQGYTDARAIREACADTDLMIVEGMA